MPLYSTQPCLMNALRNKNIRDFLYAYSQNGEKNPVFLILKHIFEGTRNNIHVLPLIKGTMSPFEYFFGCLCNSISTFCKKTWFFNFFSCLVQEKSEYEVYDSFFKNSYYSKNCSVSCIKFLFQLSFALIGLFFPVNIHGQLSEQFSGS